MGVDGAGGDELEADLLAGVDDQLQGAVVMRERGAVRIPDGGVREHEVDNAV